MSNLNRNVNLTLNMANSTNNIRRTSLNNRVRTLLEDHVLTVILVIVLFHILINIQDILQLTVQDANLLTVLKLLILHLNIFKHIIHLLVHLVHHKSKQ